MATRKYNFFKVKLNHDNRFPLQVKDDNMDDFSGNKDASINQVGLYLDKTQIEKLGRALFIIALNGAFLKKVKDNVLPIKAEYDKDDGCSVDRLHLALNTAFNGSINWNEVGFGNENEHANDSAVNQFINTFVRRYASTFSDGEIDGEIDGVFHTALIVKALGCQTKISRTCQRVSPEILQRETEAAQCGGTKFFSPINNAGMILEGVIEQKWYCYQFPGASESLKFLKQKSEELMCGSDII